MLRAGGGGAVVWTLCSRRGIGELRELESGQQRGAAHTRAPALPTTPTLTVRPVDTLQLDTPLQQRSAPRAAGHAAPSGAARRARCEPAPEPICTPLPQRQPERGANRVKNLIGRSHGTFEVEVPTVSAYCTMYTYIIIWIFFIHGGPIEASQPRVLRRHH